MKLVELGFPVSGYEDFIGTYIYTGARKAIIDVGPARTLPHLFAALKLLSVPLEEINYLILTHIHIDHAGGAGAALRQMPRARVIVHPRGVKHLVSPQALWESSQKTLGQLALEYGQIDPVPEERITVATDGMSLDMGGGRELQLWFTPGHAVHHLSIYDPCEKTLLAGEAAGVCLNGIIRLATPPPFRLAESLAAIDKLLSLQPTQICYGHFGCFDQAGARLACIRAKTLMWYEWVHQAARENRDLEYILTYLRQKEPDLGYLDSLPERTFAREKGFLFNVIQGLLSDTIGPLGSSGEK
jgi:glyoxylase-like metal-dependent hydrolase (beta-lactamase superfamily II)